MLPSEAHSDVGGLARDLLRARGVDASGDRSETREDSARLARRPMSAHKYFLRAFL